ncbi:MAG: hemolysin family protein, partial [Dehalococcoidia bacterium]
MNGLVAALLKIVLIIGVVLVHGYFVASEYSLVTLRRTRIEQLAESGNRAARLVRDTLQNLSELVAAVQLGVTMASLALGALAEPTIAAMLDPAFGFIQRGWRPITAHGIAVAVTFLLITAVDIVIAELVPKTIALRDPEPVAFVIIRPIRAFIWLFRPFLAGLNAAGGFIISLTGFGKTPAHAAHSTEELKMVVAQSTRAGVLDTDEQEMLVRVLEFSELSARQIMVPRTEVVGLEAGTSRNRVYDILG